MKFSNCNGGISGGPSGSEPRKTIVTSSNIAGYIIVRENAIKWWTTVQGLSPHEIRLLTEKVADQPESSGLGERERVVEFSSPTWQVLNGLDKMGYRVVSSSNLITGYAKFDTRDMVWTLHKARDEWEASSK